MEDLISKILNVEDISSFLKSFFIALLLSPILLILYLFRKRFLFGYARLNNWFEKKYEFYKKSLSAHEGLIFKFLTFSFKAILGSGIFAGVIQFWMIIFLLFGIIFSIYIGRFLYKYIISNLFTNLKLSRQRTVVAKLLIHKYYLRDYNIFHWLQQMLSLENFDNSFHEKLEKVDIVPLKCYLYIIKKSLASLAIGILFVMIGAIIYFAYNLIVAYNIFGIRTQIADVEILNIPIDLWILIIFFYFSIQFIFQGMTWLRPWFLRIRKLRSQNKDAIRYVNYQLFRNRFDLDIEDIIKTADEYRGATNDFKTFLKTMV